MDLFETNGDVPHRGDWEGDSSSSSSSDDEEYENEQRKGKGKGEGEDEEEEEEEVTLSYFDSGVKVPSKKAYKKKLKQSKASPSLPIWTWVPSSSSTPPNSLQCKVLIVGFGKAGSVYCFERFLSNTKNVPELVGSLKLSTTSTGTTGTTPSPSSEKKAEELASNFCNIYKNPDLPDALVCCFTFTPPSNSAFSWTATLFSHIKPAKIIAFDAAISSLYSLNRYHNNNNNNTNDDNDNDNYNDNNSNRNNGLTSLRVLKTSSFTLPSTSSHNQAIPFLETANLLVGATASLLTYCQVHRLPCTLFIAFQEGPEISSELLLTLDSVDLLTLLLDSSSTFLSTTKLSSSSLNKSFASTLTSFEQLLYSKVPGAAHLSLNSPFSRKSTIARPTPDTLYL